MSKFLRKINSELKKLQEIGEISRFFETYHDYFALATLAISGLKSQKNLLILTETIGDAEFFRDEFLAWMAVTKNQAPVHLLPEVEGNRERIIPEKECERSRVFRFTAETGHIFVASVGAAFAPAPKPAVFRDAFVELTANATDWPPERLAEYLTEMDYDNEVEVRLPGEFSRRGGIFDVYSPAYDYPIRLDYFGDEIESIRRFSPETQRSLDAQDRCLIIPRGDVALQELTTGDSCSFVDYFNQDALQVVYCDPFRLEIHLENYAEESWQSRYQAFFERTKSSSLQLKASSDRVPAETIENAPVLCSLDTLLRANDLGYSDSNLESRIEMLCSSIEFWRDRGYTIAACFSSRSKAERFEELLDTTGITVLIAPLSKGVFFPDGQLVVLSDTEVFGKAPSAIRSRGTGKGAQYHVDHMLHASTELHAGGLAVHALYGICRFQGLKLKEFNGDLQEVLVLEFADDVEVHVPLEQAYLVCRYSGAGKVLPKLSKVGHQRWKKMRGEAESAIHDLAAELLRMQAVRHTCDGHAFVGDEASMEMFIDAFPYTETPDQDVAAAEILADMAQPRPMDRLLCGDVGFGKTEVAMRAAFRAILDGSQVAVLVPTTVLCQQHYLSFSERFREFPVNIAQLSRFQSRKEQRKTLQAVREGRVDIVIGTHRLLSEDIRFKNLGLMVIDEEQRFGVASKEQLKQLRMNVDVLTMTATPIPRTLHLSMSGLRDMSTISTPPLERLPVQTIVTHHSNELIREVILRELEREGQVFVLHNRVQTIDAFAEHIQQLVPEASLDVGHGQMHEDDLEAVMLRFMGGNTDVLVSTTIIESGLDIPNANTIIIDRADRFGLAELYQLRGRVGRYHRQAYAYLLIPGKALLHDSAKKRLAAIRKYTQLGAGFKLALRDLEIRGTGNILGKEQSGHITAIGFELYCRLLKEAVSRMKGQPSEQRKHVSLRTDFISYSDQPADNRLSACLPRIYIEDETLRVDTYRRLSQLTQLKDVDAFAEELTDRFGVLPDPVIHFLMITRIKILAANQGIHTISIRDGKAFLEKANGFLKRGGKIPQITGNAPEKMLRNLLSLLKK